jgi:hypothetical protein
LNPANILTSKFPKIYVNIISHPSLDLPSDIFSSGFRDNILNLFRIPPVRAACPIHLILPHFTTPNNKRWKV